ncbi:hypothetical protein PR003_g33615 [Phytophthora rubi]|uniref:Uncharacterized protein n=1 Tax=Phytophthora rubi TaxID=129364 RepID=A0A6A4ASP9_9STRA|nr:hypothetical protein PR003_g33615 [Phytophthora rubi]
MCFHSAICHPDTKPQDVPESAHRPSMKCASLDCSCADPTKTEHSGVCGLGDRICSNDIYDSGSLFERFCSATYLFKYGALTSPPSARGESKRTDKERAEMHVLLKLNGKVDGDVAI